MSLNSAEPLIGQSWHIEQIDDDAVLEGSLATVNFDADGRLFGKASCNGYGGQYGVSDGVWRLSQMFTTKRLCEPALMRQEQAVLDRLRDTVRVDLAGDLLTLGTEDGRRLQARAVVE